MLTLDEIQSELADLRDRQSACFSKQQSSPDVKGEIRALVAKSGMLDEIEIESIIDEVLRKPPLWSKSSSKIRTIWRAAKRKAKVKVTDDVIADRYQEQYLDARMFTRSRWYTWNGSGVWVDDCDVPTEIWDKMIALKSLNVNPTSHKRRSVEERLQGRSMMGIKEDDVDAHGYLLNFTNGVYNFNTGELLPHSPAFKLTTQLPFDFDPGAECPRWQAFLEQVLIDRAGNVSRETIRFIQQAFGYSLTAQTRREVSFWLQGSGSNGKSTLLNVLAAMSGTAAMSLNLGMLEKERYQLASLAGVRVVLCAESPVGLKIADAIIKGLISGEPMSVRFPYGKPFQMTPVCKIWWAMNNPPRVADTSDGFWRRVRVVPFRARFDNEGTRPDIDLKHKLYTELPGIFNWSLTGMVDLEQNGWARSPEITEATGAYRESNDIEQAFVDSQCIVDPDAFTPANELYDAYRQWCSATGHRAKSLTRVASDWVRLGFEKKRTSNSVDYLGVGLFSQALPDF